MATRHYRPPDPKYQNRAHRQMDVPQPGFFRLRLVRGGPWIPALIYAPCPFDEDGWPVDPYRAPVGAQRWSLRALIGGRDDDPLRVWQYGQRCTAREYHKMVAAKTRAETYAPHEPEANPWHPIDLAHQPSLF